MEGSPLSLQPYLKRGGSRRLETAATIDEMSVSNSKSRGFAGILYPPLQSQSAKVSNEKPPSIRLRRNIEHYEPLIMPYGVRITAGIAIC